MKTIEQELQERKKREQWLRRNLQERMRPVFLTIEDLESGKIKRFREREYESSAVILDHDKPKWNAIPEYTLNDMLASLHDKKVRKFSRRRSRADKIIGEIEVSEQVRAAWHQKFGLVNVLTDDTKLKLRQMTKNLVTTPTYDELKLVAMITSILRTWKPVNKLV